MQVGEIVAQRFRLEGSIASGGMGTVFRALDLETARPVAVKTCNFTAGGVGSDSSRAQARFELEACALSEISDVSVVGYVGHGLTHGGEPYLVMDWVEGESLAARLSAGGLTFEQSWLLAKDLVRALGVIHARNIVHRDLKPANVMLRDCDVRRAVLVDFGVARRAENVSVTLSGARVGTLLYMAPEQIRDPRCVDGRADVFALGCVLFECLTGVRAFDAEDALATIAQILLDDAPDPRDFRAELPEDAATLVKAMLARERDARPHADRALERDLEAVAARHRHRALGVPGPVSRRPTGTRKSIRASNVTADSEIEPSPRARESPKDALLDEIPGTPSAPRRRPMALRSDRFVGREPELLHLAALAQSGADVVVLWGPAGIGKTRLVQEMSRRGGSGRLAQVEFVDLSHARDLDDAIRFVTRGIAASVRGDEDAEQVVGRALGRLGACLFVFDRVEHIAKEFAAVLELWRRAAPGVCFLLTSRERLRVDGAVSVELGPLPVAVAGDLHDEPGELSPAGLLFAERVRQACPEFSPEPALARCIESAARALEGIPLAIELAAARVRLLGLEGVVARLPKQLELLGRGPASEEGGQATMRAAISGSVELLSPFERRAFAQCAVFRGGFTVADAEAVLLADAGAPAILDLLQSLRDKSLLASSLEENRAEEPRLFSFSVIRQYALSELDQSGEEHVIRARHAAYFRARALELGRDARQRDPEAVARIERDSDDLIAAVEYALAAPEKDVSLGLEALVALEPVISTRGPLPSFMHLIDRAIGAAATPSGDGEGPVLSRLRLIRARVAATSGRFEPALEDLGRVLAHAEARGDIAFEAAAELERGVVHHLRRSLDDARACYERALGLLRTSGDPELQGRCYGNLGALLHDRGHFTEAAAYYWRAVGVLEETGELRMRGNFLNNLGVLEQELGGLARARKHYEKALTLLCDARDARLRGITLGNLGVLEQECSSWQRARRCHEQALALFEPLDDAHSEALCLGRLGATLATLGALDEAEGYLNRAQRRLTAGEPSRLEAVRLHRAFLDLALARRAFAAGDVEEGRARRERAVERCQRVEREEGNEPPLAARSDDIRITLRILKPMLAALTPNPRA